jgi:hypothetical protein
VAVPESAKVRLRGIGSLAESEAVPAQPGEARRVFEMAERLATQAEVATGVWMRQIDLENPK